jgi:hypothetical protein
MEENEKENVETSDSGAQDAVWEQLPYNKHERYIPTEFQVIDYRRSWKKCHCGRQTWLSDNWCPECGQKLGMPNIYDD